MQRICPECNTPTEAEHCAVDGRLTVEADRLSIRTRDPFIGLIIEGKYELQERIGRGGMGSVYKATHRETGGLVAIKVMRADLVEDESAIRRFYIEAQNTHRLHHPNTIRIADFGQSDEGILFLVMEYVKGRSLMSVLKAEGQLAPARAVHIICQVLKSLGEAHQQGIIHRDIKPDNVMLIDQFGEPDFVKVLDFGISRTLEGTGASTRGAIGTPKYMAPEQWRGERLDARADLYACGCLLYRMLSGKQAFHVEGRGSQQVVGYMTAHLNTPPRPFDVALPESLKALTMSMLEKSADDRPAGALETLERLRQITKEEELSTLPAARPATETPSSLSSELPTITPSQAHHPLAQELGQTLSDASATGLPDAAPSAKKRPKAALIMATAGLITLASGGLYMTLSEDTSTPAANPRAIISSPQGTQVSSEKESTTEGAQQTHKDDLKEPSKTLTLRSRPEGATLSTLEGERLGETPMTLSLRAEGERYTLGLAEGDLRPLKSVRVSQEGFITQVVSLRIPEGADPQSERVITLSPLPRLRVTANADKTPVSLVGEDKVLGETPFEWTPSDTLVQRVLNGEALTLRFGEGERQSSLVLKPEHLDGTRAIHGTVKGIAADTQKRKGRSVKRPKRSPGKKKGPQKKKGSGSWGW